MTSLWPLRPKSRRRATLAAPVCVVRRLCTIEVTVSSSAGSATIVPSGSATCHDWTRAFHASRLAFAPRACEVVVRGRRDGDGALKQRRLERGEVNNRPIRSARVSLGPGSVPSLRPW